MATNSSGATIDDLKSEIATLQGDLGQIAETLKDLTAQAGQENVAKAKQFGAEARRQVSEAQASAERAIVERPFASTAIAFGVGFLVGKLMERR